MEWRLDEFSAPFAEFVYLPERELLFTINDQESEVGEELQRPNEAFVAWPEDSGELCF